ncbi:MAG: hypothetical protein ACI9TV_000963 [Sulfurimonas sp.]|jgi:hypothetical protein|uniref:hypothetical protein n=1 Tax=Sulfurimonas sp. TaxID=2022749 RepID=UPI0039E50C55
MKIILLVCLSSVYLLSAGFWTLTGVTKANIYIVNEIPFLDPKVVVQTKEKMRATLLKNGIKTDQQDSPTLMMTFKEIEGEDNHYVYVELALGEDAQTLRDNKATVFVISYLVSEFLELDSEELDSGISESVDFVLSEFSEQYEDDKD